MNRVPYARIAFALLCMAGYYIATVAWHLQAGPVGEAILIGAAAYAKIEG